jgi:hypothetical protein
MNDIDALLRPAGTLALLFVLSIHTIMLVAHA